MWADGGFMFHQGSANDHEASGLLYETVVGLREDFGMDHKCYTIL